MTKETLPVTGDRLSDGFPSIEKIVKVTFGATSGEVQCSCQATFALCTIPEFAQVTDVGWMVDKLFTAAVDLTIGDTGNTAGWAEVADINATVVDTFIMWASHHISDASTQPAYHFAPPVYSTGGAGKDLSATVATADPATGQMSVYVKYHMAYGQKHY